MSGYNLPPDLARAFNDLANRVSALERTRTIVTGSGAPTQTPPDGAMYVDLTNSKFYVRVSGVWKSTVLT